MLATHMKKMKAKVTDGMKHQDATAVISIKPKGDNLRSVRRLIISFIHCFGRLLSFSATEARRTCDTYHHRLRSFSNRTFPPTYEYTCD